MTRNFVTESEHAGLNFTTTTTEGYVLSAGETRGFRMGDLFESVHSSEIGYTKGNDTQYGGRNAVSGSLSIGGVTVGTNAGLNLSASDMTDIGINSMTGVVEFQGAQGEASIDTMVEISFKIGDNKTYTAEAGGKVNVDGTKAFVVQFSSGDTDTNFTRTVQFELSGDYDVGRNPQGVNGINPNVYNDIIQRFGSQIPGAFKPVMMSIVTTGLTNDGLTQSQIDAAQAGFEGKLDAYLSEIGMGS
jgi:hypothetical protein